MSYPYQVKSYEEYKAAYKRSIDEPESFWAEIAENFLWRKKWDKVLDWNFKEPKLEWFAGGKLNITEKNVGIAFVFQIKIRRQDFRESIKGKFQSQSQF